MANLRPSWRNRRLVIVFTLLFCAGVVTYIVVWGDDRRVIDTIAMCCFGLAFATIGSYVFGAVWDDDNVMKRIGPAAYAPQPEPGTTNTTVVVQKVEGDIAKVDGPET